MILSLFFYFIEFHKNIFQRIKTIFLRQIIRPGGDAPGRISTIN